MQEREQGRFLLQIVAELQLISDRFTDGQINQATFVERYSQFMVQVYEGELQRERQEMREAEQKLGIESLTTDTIGNRSAQWFARTRKPFATGVATRCLAVAVIHPDFGMGAAHRNPITLDVATRSAERVASAFSSGKPLSLTGAKDMLTSKDIQRFTTGTVSEAIAQFGLLLPVSGRLGGVMTVALTGMDFLSDLAQQTVLDRSVKTIQERLYSMLRKVDVSIEVMHQIGLRGGVIYGGSNHPQYPTPAFYTL